MPRGSQTVERHERKQGALMRGTSRPEGGSQRDSDHAAGPNQRATLFDSVYATLRYYVFLYGIDRAFMNSF